MPTGLEKPTGLLVERIRKPRENPREKERETQESEGASTPPRTCSGIIRVDTGRGSRF